VLALGAGANIVLWDLVRGKEVRRFGCQQMLARSIVFSPDGTLLAAGSTDGVVHLWDTATGTELASCQGHRGPVTVVAMTADGRTLISGGADTTALVWDVRALVEMGRQRQEALATTALEARWKDLAGADSGRAYQAIATLAQTPRQTVPFLQARLRPIAPVEAERLNRFLADLEHDQFDVRQKAMEELEKLDTLAETALRKALAGKPSLEVQRRVTTLLEKLEGAVTSPDVLRNLRAVEVLEQIGTTEARQLLEQLAGGAADARLTCEAKSAQERLAKRPFAMP
jgi:hypothetical protein